MGDLLFRWRSLLVCAAFITLDASAGPFPPFPGLRLVVPVGHSNLVNAVAYSADGRWILSGSMDNTARIWNAETGQEVLSVPEAQAVVAVAFAPDGKHFAVGNGDGSARIYEIASARPVQFFGGHTSQINALAFSSDGAFLVTGSGFDTSFRTDCTVRVWQVSTGKEIHRFEGHRNGVSAVAFLPGDQRVISVSLDGTARIWDIKTNAQVELLPADGKPIRSLAISRDGKQVLVGGGELTTRTSFNSSWSLWNLESGVTVRHFVGTQRPITTMEFSPDGKSLLSCSMDGLMAFWDAQTGKQLREFGSKRTISFGCSARYSPDGRYFVASSLDSLVRIWHSEDGKLSRALGGRVANVNFAAAARDGRLIATALSDGTSVVWDTKIGKPIRRLPRNNAATTSLALSRDSRFLVTGSGNYFADEGHVTDNVIELWDLTSGSLVKKFSGNAGVVTALDISRDNRLILTANGNGTVRIWNSQSGARSFEKNFSIGSVPPVSGPESAVFSPDGRFFAVGLRNNIAVVVATSSGKEVKRFAEPNQVKNLFGAGVTIGVKALAFSPDGHYLFVAADDGVTRKIDLNTNQVALRFGPSPFQTTSLSVSEDGKTLLAGNGDGSVRLWSVDTGKLLRLFYGHSDRVTAVGFLGKDVVTASQDGTARLWDSASGRELARLVSFAGDQWTVVDAIGRFDAQDGGTDSGLYWLDFDDPLHSLPLEIFQRDYYTPRLLVTAVTRAERPVVRSFTSLNRIQPGVIIAKPSTGSSPSEALVDVTVYGKSDTSQKSGKSKTAAYDLRLFRNDQLVGEFPEPAHSRGAGPQELDGWRSSSLIKGTEDGRAAVKHTFHVRLPSTDHGKPVVFTAYAFNEDRVKSATATNAEFNVPESIARREARAYVIAIGINDYHTAVHNLEFAVKDAQVMATALGSVKGHVVIPITLVTDEAHGGVAATNQATKSNIRTVLEILAGKTASKQRLQSLRNAGVDANVLAKLDKVTPDDAVIITYSGHGYTEPTGAFYLLPAGSWSGGEIGPASLAGFISSEELSEWLRNVDAGEIAMIIDACHSAASVNSPGFKPGPMGDRGLGQLAYDKRMRILAATQSDDVALEIRDLKEGLLTYALVEEGLSRDQDGRLVAAGAERGELSLSAWLKYGEQRTPGLYVDALQHKVVIKPKDSTADPDFLSKFLAAQQARAQTPTLFDFQPLKAGITLR